MPMTFRPMLTSRGCRVVSGAAILLALLLTGMVFQLGSVSSAAGKLKPSTKTFKNPVYSHNVPDPFILRIGKTYYAYATGTCSSNFQALQSHDLVHWTAGKDPMPALPSWATGACNSFFQNRMTWAPEVLRRADGKYVLYYVAHATKEGSQCVGHAVSNSPVGPFVDSDKQPFICQTSLGGSIDPGPFKDSNGKLYLLWKNDGNCCGKDTYIWVQQMSADGMKLVGKSARVDKQSHLWEGNLIEAPTMWKHGGQYYLFFSANDFASSNYAVGYAVCKGAQGPCQDGPHNPILSSRCNAAGPGGQSIITDARGQTWIAYHAWNPRYIGDNSGGPGRVLWLDRLDWRKGAPIVHGPTCKAQPDPAPFQ